MASKDGKHAQELQKKIFGRWVKLKLSTRSIAFDDVLKDLADGLNLISLVEILSDKEYANRKKLVMAPKNRPQIIDNCSQALAFCWEVGIDMKLKPSPENLADGNETMILGLLWSIMLRFMKFGDEENTDQSLSAKDALMMWVQNQVASYHNVKIENMTKSFHDGLAFCALIHKFRPRLIAYDTLSPDNVEDNLKLAFTAAEKFFSLEQYLLPSDIKELDEKSMVVYISEYYYGIAQQRKVDLAVRRIQKLIKFTKEMDAKKKDFVARAKAFKATVDGICVVLNDRTIDNTMSGAKKKLEDFYTYKTGEKTEVTNTYLEIESGFNQLSLKLADNKRPDYKPESGCSIPELRQVLADLEAVEKERKIALQAELNRQIKLAKTNELHQERAQGLIAWCNQKKAYLETKEEIHSVGEAELQLNTLAAFIQEQAAVDGSIVSELKKQGDYLHAEKFEFSDQVTSRETEIADFFGQLTTLAQSKRTLLDDHLAREKYAEEIRGLNQQHVAKHDKQQAFISEKKTYFSTKENVNSVSDANLHLSLCRGQNSQKADLQAATYPALQSLGKQVTDAKYESSFSSWVFEFPDTVRDRESNILAGFNECDALFAKKLEILEDDLAREKFKEAVRLQNQQHIARQVKIMTWITESHAYLTKKEVVESISEANLQLSLLSTHVAEKADMVANNFVALKGLGDQICSAKYETQFSQWVFEDPAGVRQRETDVDGGFSKTDSLAAVKLEILQDDLARETFKENIRLKNQQHIDKHAKMMSWIEDSKQKLEKKEDVHSIPEANLQLSLLQGWMGEKKDVVGNNFRALAALGAEVRDSKYSTQHSQWAFEQPATVTTREDEATAGFATCDTLAAAKLLVLEDDLARETFRENLRLQNEQHIDRQEKIKAWIAESKRILTTTEPVDSITEANTNLSNLAAWKAEQNDVSSINVGALKRLGADILSAKYSTQYSEYVFPNPPEVQEREAHVDTEWIVLNGLCDTKHGVLVADLERERRKEALRLQFANLAQDFTRWVQDVNNSSTQTVFGFTLAEVEAFGATLNGLDAESATEADKKKGGYDAVWQELTELKVTRNIYTTHNPETLAAVRVSMEDALKARQGKYADELARQRANDTLCKEFAEIVHAFVHAIDASKDEISASKQDAEKQLGEVEAKIAASADNDMGLGKVRTVQGEIEGRGITDNIHTILTAKDAEVLWEQYVQFLQRKKATVEAEIAHKKLRGLTVEQMQEIELQFNQFDKNKNGFLDRAEFKTCLYSLNEDKSKQEVTQIMDKYGESGQIRYEGFREFMITVLGDSDTKEEVVEGFRLINKGKEHTDEEMSAMVMNEDDMVFIKSTAPQKESGYDYVAWTEEVYAR